MIPLLRGDDREPLDELGLATTVVVPPLRGVFRERLRRRIRAAAAGPVRPRRPPAWGYAIVAALILMFASVTASAVAEAAAGDALFDVKLALEEVERSVAPDDAALLMVLAAQADRRHDELRKLLAEGSPNAGRALGVYVTAISRLSDLAGALASRSESDRDRAAGARARGARSVQRARRGVWTGRRLRPARASRAHRPGGHDGSVPHGRAAGHAAGDRGALGRARNGRGHRLVRGDGSIPRDAGRPSRPARPPRDARGPSSALAQRSPRRAAVTRSLSGGLVTVADPWVDPFQLLRPCRVHAGIQGRKEPCPCHAAAAHAAGRCSSRRRSPSSPSRSPRSWR